MIKKINIKKFKLNLKKFNLTIENKQNKKEEKLKLETIIFDKSAMIALESSFNIREYGFNVFIVGNLNNINKKIINEIIKKKIIKKVKYNDIISLHNFHKKNDPIIISIPHSRGLELKNAYNFLTNKILQKLQNLKYNKKKIMKDMIEILFENLKKEWIKYEHILMHLNDIQENILNNLKTIIKNKIENNHSLIKSLFRRYKVNILVENIDNLNPPIVFEDNPTKSNLTGKIKEISGNKEIDNIYDLIEAGSLIKSNNGCLILKAKEILDEISIFNVIKQALKNNIIEIENPNNENNSISININKIPLSLNIILIGTFDVYYSLLKNDLEFEEIFKIKIYFNVDILYSQKLIYNYSRFLIQFCEKNQLQKLTLNAIYKILEYAIMLTSDKKKITTKLENITDLILEANFLTNKDKSKKIKSYYIEKALYYKTERNSFIKNMIINDILSNKVNIQTSGHIIGQCNGLTIVEVDCYEFGIPLRITCKIRAGYGDIMDIERESKLGGSIHTKGIMIIKGLLSDKFGLNMSFSMLATICIEQNYFDIDGDSASLAEACSLFSALAMIPISQSFAITGSIDQHGRVQSVGSISKKIEGFFDICSKRKLKKCPTVILPKVNIDNIFLNKKIIKEYENKNFSIIAVKTLEETMEIITGKKWENGENSIKKNIIKTLKYFKLLQNK